MFHESKSQYLHRKKTKAMSIFHKTRDNLLKAMETAHGFAEENYKKIDQKQAEIDKLYNESHEIKEHIEQMKASVDKINVILE